METIQIPSLQSSFSFLYYHVIETIALGALILLFFIRRRRPKPSQSLLTEEQENEIIAQWKPEPLVPEATQPARQPRIIDGKMEKFVTLDGKTCLNLGTNNYLGFIGDGRIEKVAKSTILKYGVGSCGPRSFYGTVDVHLELEKQLATFMGCEEAALYSYGFATIASAIPAYAKRTDIIYVDKEVNYAIQMGILASRSKIEWFNHNDMDGLEALLKAQEEKDKKNPKLAAKTRKFIIVEGLYSKTADLCPLKRIIELKWQYKVRVFIDESLSFGVIGKTGRGVTEHFGVDVIDVDMIMASLENAIASTGGFCCGRTFVIEHQRLSGLGYCFSASLPPLLTTAAGEAVKIMDAEPERFERLRRNAKQLHDGLTSACKDTEFAVKGIEISPLKHIVHRSNDEAKLEQLVDQLFNVGVLVSVARYLTSQEAFPTIPSVKVMCSSEMTSEEIGSAIEKINQTLH